MEIRKTYKCLKNGIVGFYCGFMPKDGELIEEYNVLFSKDGYILQRKATKENVGNSIVLLNGDVKENYREEEHVEPEPQTGDVNV